MITRRKLLLFIISLSLFSVTCQNPAIDDTESGEETGGFAAPTGLRALRSGSGVEVTWNPVKGAEAYEFYYAEGLNNPASAQRHDDTQDPVFVMEELACGVSWYFWVKAKNASGETSPYSSPASIMLPVSPPPQESIMAAKDTKALTVSWQPVGNATGYEVWGSTSSSNLKRLTVVPPAQTWYTVTQLENGKPYFVKLKSVYAGGVSDFSALVSGTPGDSGQPGDPVFFALAELDGGRVCVMWNAAANAVYYELLYNNTNNIGTATTVSPIYGTDYMLGEKTGEDLAEGTEYYLWLRAKAGSKESNLAPSPETAVPGRRVAPEWYGTFFSRWPNVGSWTGQRPYYMDGHQFGPISEMHDVFPFNVAGRPSVIGPSPGKYQVSSHPYPLPGGEVDIHGNNYMAAVLPSGYAVQPDDQYVYYAWGPSPDFTRLGIVRAVIRKMNGSANRYLLCEYLNPVGGRNYFVFGLLRGDPDYNCVLGLLPLGGAGAAKDLSPGDINLVARTFSASGVAYPAIRLGYLGNGQEFSGWVDPNGSLFNPLLIRPERIAEKVDPRLAELGLSYPDGWFNKTASSDPPLDPAFINVFWDAVDW
jgi:hypothetical protein